MAREEEDEEEEAYEEMLKAEREDKRRYRKTKSRMRWRRRCRRWRGRIRRRRRRAPSDWNSHISRRTWLRLQLASHYMLRCAIQLLEQVQFTVASCEKL